MPSALPTDPALTKSVHNFGLGPYDSSRADSGSGEDDESREPAGQSLPDDGGSLDPFGPDRLLSYPETFTSQGKHASCSNCGSDAGYWKCGSMSCMSCSLPFFVRSASAILPGDEDRPPTRRRPADDTKDDVVPTMGQSELPSDSGNPSARSDYYDHMQTGRDCGFWPMEDTGAYAGEEMAESALPSPGSNDVTMDDFLGALGNAWSGYVVEDNSNPRGFPTENFLEEADYVKRRPSYWKDDSQTMASRTGADMRTSDYDFSPASGRTATNIALAGELAAELLKKHGKAGLTRRHVMAFLQAKGVHQYMASDVIRCLKHRHKVVMADVLDQFPVAKVASGGRAGLASIRDLLIKQEIRTMREPAVASVFRHCAANLSRVIADLERLEGRDG